MPDRRRVLALIASSAGLARLDLRPAAAQVADLIAAMTLDEKIGQLTILSADFTVTGPTASTATSTPTCAPAGSAASSTSGAARRCARRSASRSRRPASASRSSSASTSSTASAPSSRSRSPRPAPSTPRSGRRPPRHAAAEAAAAGLDLTFAPMLDIARDPRWGRIAEGPGEDPYVGARFAEAKVRGIQGAELSGLAATPKHFVAYGASAAGRDYAPVDVSDRALAEIYLPPFRAAVDAGAARDHARLHRHRRRAAHRAPRAPHRHPARATGASPASSSATTAPSASSIRHGVAADAAEAAALALNAGVDIDMMSLAYRQRPARGAAPRPRHHRRHRRRRRPRARAQARLGLFDDPYRRCTGPDPETPARRATRRAAARDAAARSLVLLQNRGDALPLPAPPGRIALIGPLADARRRDARALGRRRARRRGGERARRPARRPARSPDRARPGRCRSRAATTAGIAAAVAAAAARADQVILCLGEAAWMSGEAASRARIDLPGRQAELAAAVLATGRPVVVLLFSGRPIAHAGGLRPRRGRRRLLVPRQRGRPCRRRRC